MLARRGATAMRSPRPFRSVCTRTSAFGENSGSYAKKNSNSRRCAKPPFTHAYAHFLRARARVFGANKDYNTHAHAMREVVLCVCASKICSAVCAPCHCHCHILLSVCACVRALSRRCRHVRTLRNNLKLTSPCRS